MRSLSFLLLFAALTVSAWGDAPLAAVSVSSEQEDALAARLRDKGIEVLFWSNALVEVSAFEGLEWMPVGELGKRLTPQDPRWDPWLESIGLWFHPGTGVSQLWVPANRLDEARSLVGGVAVKTGRQPITPRLVTGWAVISFTLLFVVLTLVVGFKTGWPRRADPRSWLWAGVSAPLLILGALLVLGSGRAAASLPRTAVSWVQHRWFQESFPWGAQWKDYEAGKPWTYRSYEHKDGKVAEVRTALAAPDAAWVKAAESALDPRAAVRIFGSENP